MPMTSRSPISVDRAASSTPRSCSPRPPIGTTCSHGSPGSSAAAAVRPTCGVRGPRPISVITAGGCQAIRHCSSVRRCRRTRSHAATCGPEVRSVSTVADLARWERVAIDGYPLPDLQDAPVGGVAAPALLDDERVRFLVGLDGERVVAAAASFTSHGIGSLSYGVTLPESRRRGYWRRLAIERLRATPDLWMTGVFSDFSRPGAETLGFVPLLSPHVVDPRPPLTLQPPTKGHASAHAQQLAPTATATRSRARRQPSTATTPPSTTSSPTATSCWTR